MKVSVDVVNVDVTVTDARGNFVRGLKREQFRILDEGTERPITNFASIEAPAQVLLLVETSPAVYLIHRQHLQAALALLNGLAGDDQVALATYDEAPRLVVNLTQDRDVIYSALNAPRYNLGSTQLNFFDAVGGALNWLAPIPGKKALVLLSTGLDTSKPSRWNVVAEKLRSSDAVVYAVALGGELREFKPKSNAAGEEENPLSFEEANRVLEEMAATTGGRAYFPKRVEEFPRIYAEIAACLRNQYSLGFAPAAQDGAYRHIEIQVLDAQGRVLLPQQAKNARPKMQLRARRGYLAPKPPQ